MFSKKDRSGSRSAAKPAIQHSGIDNLGNSCYLNSVLQSLAASGPLRDALSEYPGADKVLHASEDGRNQDNSQATASPVIAPGTPTAETSPTLQVLTRENAYPEGLPLSSALASTLVKLWAGKQSSISVKSLMKALNRKNEDWNEYDQMDAHELLRYLLDGVSMEEIDLIKKLHPPSPVKQKKRKQGAKSAERKKDAVSRSATSSSSESDSDDLDTSEAESLLAEDPTYRMPAHPLPAKKYTPFIDTIFGGKLASVIVCEECRGVSRIEEDFLDISLPLKSDEGKVKRRDRLRNFLSSSAASQSKTDGQRPKLAPRAPTAILSVSETEGSEGEDLSIASARSRESASGRSGAEQTGSTSASEQLDDDSAAKVRRRKSLDPGLLRSKSVGRSFLSPMGNTGSARSRDPSPLSRKSSVRTSGADTTGSEASQAPENSRKTKEAVPPLLSKPTREQQEYIQKLFAEIPGPSPLAGLRIAQPHGNGVVHPTAAEANGSSLALADAMSTGLYSCLMQFTSVEMLEGDNAFQCRRCWKLLNPGLVAQVGRKRAAKAREAAMQKDNHRKADQASHVAAPTALLHRKLLAESTDGTPLARNEASKDYWAQQTTPRASVSMGSPTETNTIEMNRKLLAERERQISENHSGDVSPAVSNSAAEAREGPEITVTATSPPMSPPSAKQALPTPSPGSSADEAGQSGFSQLTVTESRTTVSDHGSSGSRRSALDELSDGGAEADESDSESAHAKKSARTSVVSFSDHSPPGQSLSNSQLLQKQAAVPAGVPALPPRAQRCISRRAHKRYLISSLPQILVLHLKRFQQTSKSSLFGQFNNLKKLDDKVTFPLYLDMAPFMAPPPLKPKHSSEMEKLLGRDDLTSASSAGEESDRGRAPKKEHHHHHHRHWFRRASPPPELRENCQYRLYAVIVHQGSMQGGHYICYVLTPQRRVEGEQVTDEEKQGHRQWLYCSDHIVKAASTDEVLKSQAYCLLYERVPPKSGSKL